MTAGSTAPLAGKHALVTGAAGGIGRAIAGRLAAAGSRTTLAGRRRDALEAVAATLPEAQTHIAAGFDVTDPEAVAAGIAEARAALGPIDILVNCAGEAPSAPFERTGAPMWDDILATNLTSVFNVIQATLPDLKASGDGARIVNVASTAGLKGYRYVSAYCAAKHGVVGLTRALALEFVRYGITVNAVCPGFTDTPLVANAVLATAEATGKPAEAVLAELVRSNPQGRLVRPDEVADAVLWLALPSSSAITGQAIAVAGGEI